MATRETKRSKESETEAYNRWLQSNPNGIQDLFVTNTGWDSQPITNKGISLPDKLMDSLQLVISSIKKINFFIIIL